MIALLLACVSGTPIQHQSFTVGCGMCMFGQMSSGCYWAAKVDGKIVPIGGPGVPSDTDLPSHGPGGMCTMERRAFITGTRHDDKIIADVFELVPAAPVQGKSLHDHKH